MSQRKDDEQAAWALLAAAVAFAILYIWLT